MGAGGGGGKGTTRQHTSTHDRTKKEKKELLLSAAAPVETFKNWNFMTSCHVFLFYKLFLNDLPASVFLATALLGRACRLEAARCGACLARYGLPGFTLPARPCSRVAGVADSHWTAQTESVVWHDVREGCGEMGLTANRPHRQEQVGGRSEE